MCLPAGRQGIRNYYFCGIPLWRDWGRMKVSVVKVKRKKGINERNKNSQ